MLKGSNAPRLLELWETVSSQGDVPYTIRTVLGWVIDGPLNGSRNASNHDMALSSVLVSRISVSNLELMLKNQYDHDFNEVLSEEKQASREDLQFMKIMEGSAMLQKGRYYLKLPFKNADVLLPNNFPVAKQRMLGLRRRFVNDPKFHVEYSSYMKGVIDKGYAEQVPQEQMLCSGRMWYIPHHRVFHPRKASLQVLFDCSPMYQETSLNQELLQGPNLTSSLLGVLLQFRQEPMALMGDVQAMYHQVKVVQQDRGVL